MANIKISELNPLLTVEDADVLPIVDNGVTKKVTAAILRSYTQGNSVLLTGAQTVAGIKTFTSQLASSVATGTAPFSVASTTKVTNLNADLLDGLSSADFQATLSGSGIVKSTAGTISYLTDNSANWNTAYNDKINSAAVTGSGTNTLTLTQQDAGTITATWVNGTLIREVRNTTGATLTKGTIVYISGATGNKPTVTKAIATGDSTSAQTFGFIQSDLANNDNGYVVVVGDLTGVDTSAFAEGAQLYLSSTVAGAFTSTKQYAPAHLVYVGIVTRAHPTLGQIEVNIQNGYELDELHNVSAQSPSNGDILQFVTSTGLWTKVAGTTTNISEGTNLYYTDARARSAFSESVTGLDYNSTTGVLSTTSGYGIPTTASQATWDTAYNDSIVSAAVTGTTTKTLTLNQQDGGTVTASWTDINTDAVSSVFGRTGAVVAASGDYTTTQVTEGTNLYFTDARARAAISLTTTGTSGAATYSGGVLNIPQYQAALTNPVTGTGTTNYLPKFTGTSALGNSLIYDDGTKVSIGSTDPKTRITIKQNIDTYQGGLSIQKSDNETSLFLYNNGSANLISSTYGSTGVYVPLYFQTSDLNRLVIDTNGNVGIGTTSPAEKLSVSGAIMSTGAITGHGANRTTLSQEGSNGAYWQSYGADASTVGTFSLRQASSDFSIVRTPLHITSSGAATFSSSVQATANASGRSAFFGGASYGIRIDNSGSFNNGGSIIHGVDNTFVASYQKLSLNGSSLEFMTDYTTHLTISNTGQVSVGTPINGRLGVRGTTNNSSAYALEAANASGSTLFIVRNDGVTSVDGKFLIGTFTPGASKLSVVGLPTSASGLSTGDVWNDGGTLKIV